MKHALHAPRTCSPWLVLSILCAGGCSSSKSPPPPPTAFQLTTIGYAYRQATEDSDMPPSGKADLLPLLKEMLQNNQDFSDPAEIFRSKSDGEDFVIHWGVDLRGLNAPRSKTPVLAYEKT